MKEKLKKVLELLNLFGVTTSEKVKNIVITIVVVLSLFNFQVNVNKGDYGYLDTDTVTVAEDIIDIIDIIEGSDTLSIDTTDVK